MAEEMVQLKYVMPEQVNQKKSVNLARTEIMSAQVQVVAEGGENNLHSHTGTDGFWFVLSGSARFYSSDDDLFAEIHKYEGVLVPKGVAYWFESSGSELLEILHVGARTQSIADQRVDLREQKREVGNF